MSNPNQEIIEARLAGYIDGDIQPEERAEIEAHLRQNPQYKKLLDDLRRGRELVRGLPREGAPPEFADAFFAQIERGGLLDGDHGARPRMRIAAWPKMLAAAAIVLLTVGLAMIVYFVLPNHDPRKLVAMTHPLTPATNNPISQATTSASIRSGASADQSRPTDVKEDSQPEKSSTDKLANIEQTPSPVASAPILEKNGEPPLPLARAVSLAPSSLVPLAPQALTPRLTEVAQAMSHDRQLRDLLDDMVGTNVAPNSLTLPSDDAVVLVVQAADVQAVQRELNAYLRKNNIDSQPVTRSEFLAMDTPREQNKTLAASELQRFARSEKLNDSVRRSDDLANPDTPLAAVSGQRGGPMAGSDARISPGNAVAASRPPGSDEPDLSVPQGSATTNPGTRTSTTSSQSLKKKPDGSAKADRQYQSQASSIFPVNATLYIARRLTSAQAHDLATHLSHRGQVGEAEMDLNEDNFSDRKGSSQGASMSSAARRNASATTGPGRVAGKGLADVQAVQILDLVIVVQPASSAEKLSATGAATEPSIGIPPPPSLRKQPNTSMPTTMPSQ